MSTTKNFVILRKKGLGLRALNIRGGITEYQQERIDRESDGERIGEFKEPTLPGSRHYLAPIWNDLKDQWAWAGTQEELSQIATKLKLRYDRGAEKGNLISVNDIDVSNRNDPFFRSSFWVAKRFLNGGKLMLNLDQEVDKFFHLNYKGSHKTNDLTDPLNPAFVAGAIYEIVNLKAKEQKKSKNIRSEANALRALSDLAFKNQQLIAEIMDLECDIKDPDSLYVAIVEQACKNTEVIARYGGKTAQERFLELAKNKVADLEVFANIIRAKKARVLVIKNGYTQFNTGGRTDKDGLLIKDRLEGASSDISLINYFRKVDNQEDYIQLLKELELKDLL